jgi:spermidine synthase
MYHVISTGLTTSVLYLLSYLFYRTGFYNQQIHRKLWNTILALAFISASLAGIFLALQINYKWDIQYVKSILKWHVEFGIGLAFTGFFHFIWHFSYFRKILSHSESQNVSGKETIRSAGQVKNNLFIIGFVSTSIQLLLIREMMNIAGGYELITGTFLGSWLIGSAIGAAMARRSVLNDLRKVNLFFSLSPLISIILIITLSRLFLRTGETPSFLISIIYTLIVLIPFCFVSGFTFIKLITSAKASNNYSAGKSFSIETMGGVVAGIAVSLLTSGLLNTYQLLLLIIVLNSAYVFFSFYIIKNRLKIVTGCLIAIIVTLILVFHPDIFFRQQLLHGIKVKISKDTSYGNISIGEYGGEKSTYYNQRLLSYQNDEIEREEDIHYAMLQHNNPEKVLIISGDLKSHLPEVLKYHVKKVVYVERDPVLTKLGLVATDSLFKGLTVENSDAYRYLKRTNDKFDVIVLLLPPPSTLLLNRYYTTDFFALVKNTLGDGGIYMCSPGPGEDYYNKESTILYSSIYNSLSGVFKNVVPVVGNKMYYIASNAQISSSICLLTEKRKIKNLYVNTNFLSDDLLKIKSDNVLSIIDPDTKKNTSEFPVACFHFQSYNLSKNLNDRIPSIVLLILIFLLPVFAVKRKNLVMYVSAASLSGFEIIMLLTLQSAIGNMYQLTGIIIAALMTGLAVGTAMKQPLFKTRADILNPVLLIVFYICIGLIINHILKINNSSLTIILIAFLTFIPALVTGQLFCSLTERNDIYSDPSSVYSADLAGSALGFMFISGLAIPAIGIKLTIILLSTLIFTGLLFGTIRNK